MSNIKANAIGKIKGKSTVYCTVCGCVHHRTTSMLIFENTPDEIHIAHIKMTGVLNKVYTCNICKSVVKDLHKTENCGLLVV